MSQAQRLGRLKHLLDSGQCLTPTHLQALLEVPPATVKRNHVLAEVVRRAGTKGSLTLGQVTNRTMTEQ